jgi:RNA polymerase sigma-70 factor (sigma-E family)
VGDAAGEFEAFVSARYPSLVRAASLVALDRSVAEDLVQAALIRTYLHWPLLRTPAAAESYTQTTFVRLALRSRRRRWLGERPTSPLPERPAADQFAASDDADMVRRALAQLLPEQRAVLVLRYYLQWSEAEIASALDCSPGTVKSRASRALAALRDGGLLTASVPNLEGSDE